MLSFVTIYFLLLIYSDCVTASRGAAGRRVLVASKLDFTLSDHLGKKDSEHTIIFPVKDLNMKIDPLLERNSDDQRIPLRVLVLANLAGGVGRLCATPDWRGELGRYVAASRPSLSVVVWESARHNVAPKCFMCTRDGLNGHSFDCDQWLTSHNKSADALVLIGSGMAVCRSRDSGNCDRPEGFGDEEEFRRKHPSLYRAVHKPWVTSDTWVAHIPVSHEEDLSSNVHNFSRVVQDSDFLKPMSPSVTASLEGCGRAKREDTLIYPARFDDNDHKGQAAFLERAPAGDLDGFTVRFFGVSLTDGIRAKLQGIADRRNISIDLAGEVSQIELLGAMCHSKGVVLFPRHDANPRVVYEGLLSGCPVYASSEANVPQALLELPFVFSGRRKAPASFHDFMEAIRREGRATGFFEDIRTRSSRMLRPDVVFEDLMHKLGICDHGLCQDPDAL